MTLPPKLTRSTKLGRGEVFRSSASEDGTDAALIVEGDGIMVDFAGLALRGSSPDTAPDRRAGTGVIVRGKNVTLKNARVHGYKLGIFAKDCPGLVLENCDVSNNWKQRLASTTEKEDLSDWMSFHQNEKMEWLRYGAGIYLDGCDGFTVKYCQARGGQCGLLLTKCDGGQVLENDFSFLSALGLGMYRSSGNKILHNRFDWCVRGYSHGVYNRGQDSAGILVFEQCSRNVFAYNSVTHGGDGFFLWAGQQTMDTGRGGCDDNLLYGNDFSHAPTNGIEATFARNTFANNLVLECWHGVWGGYSYDTTIIGNVFGYNATAIAIEHGRDNLIRQNRFVRDREGVSLWKNATQDPSWAYPRKHDTTSRDYKLLDNRFESVPTTLKVRDTERVVEIGSEVRQPKPAPPLTVEASGKPILASESDPAEYARRFKTNWNPLARVPEVEAPAPLLGVRFPALPKGQLRGRRFIFVDDWGPYDFQRPILVDRGEGAFEILGPQGRWRLVTAEGATLSASSGSVPGKVRISTERGRVGTTKVALEYIGARTIDSWGRVTPKGRPVRFGFEKFVAPIAWDVKILKWNVAENPSDVHSAPAPEHWKAVLASAPIHTSKLDKLDFAGYSFAPGLPNDRWGTLAEGALSIPPGEYVLDVTTDDGCRLWLDGKLVLADAWKYQGPTLYSVPVKLGGNHRIRVEHFQIDGYASLRVGLRPKNLV